MDQAGLPDRLEGDLAERTGVDPRHRPRRRRARSIDGVLDQRHARPGPDQPVLHPDGHPEHRGGPDRHQLRDDRPQLRDGLGLRDRWPRDRRGVGDDPPRRRRRDARGRRRGRDPRGDRRRVRVDARPVDPERRPRGGLAAVRHGPRRLRRAARAPAWSSSRSSSTPRPAARRRWPSWSATARRRTPRTSRCRRRAASAPSGPPDARSRRPASQPGDIDHVNAHATSTPEGDKAELQAIRTILGEHAGDVPITANKSMIGHTLGAAGAIEAIATIHGDPRGVHPAHDQPRATRTRRPRA